MRRTIAIASLAILALAFARPATAQQSAGNMAEELEKEGKEQVSRARKYTAAANSKGYMSAARSNLNHTAADASGRVDLSGHMPPSYFQLRNQSTNFSTRAYAPAVSRRRAVRSNYFSKPPTPATSSGSTGRRPAPDDIPPPPR